MDDGEDAAASAIAFVVAGVLFLVAMGTVLYVANNKVPPEREDQSFVDYTQEARVLMQTFVRGAGDVGSWTGSWDEDVVPGLWATNAMDQDRIDSLDDSADEPAVAGDGRFQYDELRDQLNLLDAHRDIRIVMVDDVSGTTLLTYGPEIPSGFSAEPYVAYLPTDGGYAKVRVSIAIFPADFQ